MPTARCECRRRRRRPVRADLYAGGDSAASEPVDSRRAINSLLVEASAANDRRRSHHDHADRLSGNASERTSEPAMRVSVSGAGTCIFSYFTTTIYCSARLRDNIVVLGRRRSADVKRRNIRCQFPFRTRERIAAPLWPQLPSSSAAAAAACAILSDGANLWKISRGQCLQRRLLALTRISTTIKMTKWLLSLSFSSQQFAARPPPTKGDDCKSYANCTQPASQL